MDQDRRHVAPKRSLVFHAWVTFSATLLGFVMGTVLGLGLAVLIVHNEAMNRSLMPWIVASQTIPILALAPMLVVGFNTIGVTGLLPKAIISTYLSFFPVAVGMVKGLRSPEAIQLDLMHTYNASRAVFWKLRWPAAMPFLFASLKVGVAIALVGAIVGELPTPRPAVLARACSPAPTTARPCDLGRLLFAASLAALLVIAVGLVERLVLRSMGQRRHERWQRLLAVSRRCRGAGPAAPRRPGDGHPCILAACCRACRRAVAAALLRAARPLGRRLLAVLGAIAARASASAR